MKIETKNKTIWLVLLLLFLSLNGSAQQLELLIQEALENNPEIMNFDLQYNIASQKIEEVNVLPNSEIGAGYFVSEPETRTGAQRFKVSARQMIPWFGTITARENYALALADTKYEDIVIAKRKLVASVSRSYYNLYALKAKEKVLMENIELLKTYETMALTSVEVGKASAVDVLRLQMRRNEMIQLKEIIAENIISEQTRMNKLLNRDKDVPLDRVVELSIPSDTEILTADNLELHPELLKYDKLYESVVQSELLNQKESSPIIGIGLDFIAVSERPDMNFVDNGKDILMPMMSVSIPVFNKKFKSRSAQNNLKQQAINYQRKDRRNKLETALSVAIGNRNSAKISFDTQNKNLEQARNAESILIRNYETGTIDFNDILDVQELQLNFQIGKIESIKSYFTETTIINYLIAK
ncbi:MAG: TolC family protein [Bacteroidia bacterium]|nr:TolC family protein [Bacteroidia bacterium]MBT8270396.1 TolC family protein [Bacteroidia bacterium]NNF82587.1 TolC family protein [Flavobacteriaceae bacterium]NNK68847.1 TolC family protein [Flavobacteriaceae bacterium]NNL79883.1 TolC family protein [Flavobacteriaceae bacterium]